MYPRLEIDIKKLRENARILCDKCHKNNLKVAMVTKSYCAMQSVVEEISKEGIDYLADSRIQNLKNLQNIDLPKILIRIPMISELEEVIKYADISFHSELLVIKRLNDIAKLKNIIHKIVLMIDLGDLREGCFYDEEIYYNVEKILELENIELIGIATNLTCYGGVLPSKDNLGRLASIASKIREKYDLKLDFISGGNSSSLYLLDNGEMPKDITNLRLGEAIVFGKEAAYGKKIDNTNDDVFKLVCEIIEIKKKPSLPIGEIGVDAFGNIPNYEDKGIMKRAIVGIGKQDIDISSVIPCDKCIDILGASSDHMILDITNSKKDYEVGDKVEFLLKYGGLLSAATSKYVYKKIIKETVLA